MANQLEEAQGSGGETSRMREKNDSTEAELLINIPSEETGTVHEDSGKTQEGSGSKETANVAEAALPVDESNQLLPEISQSSPSHGKPPKIPVTEEKLTRRKSLIRSVYSKPKSRYVGEAYSAYGKNRSASSSPSIPRSPLMGSPRGPESDDDDDDDEEEETYKKVELSRRRVRRKLKMKSVIKWAVFLCSLGCLVASLTVMEFEEARIWGFEFWRWSVLQLVLIDGLFATNWLMRVVVFFIERNFLLKKKVLYFVYGLKRSAMVLIWAVFVIVTWAALFNHCVKRSETDKKVFSYITKNLVALLLGILLWFLKSLWVRTLASNFHVNVFFDRIQESIFCQYVLQTLSGPPLMELAETVGRAPSAGMLSFRSARTTEEQEGKKAIDISKLHKMKEEKVSSWTMKRLIDVVKNSGLSILSSDTDEEDDREIKSETEAVAAAYHIFKNVARPGCKYIDEDDLLRFMIKEEVDLVFPLFDEYETGRIDRQALTDWVVKVYKDRKVLGHALNDTHIVVRQLNKFVTWIVILVAFNVWLLLLELSSTQVLVSQLLGAAFIFGNTCKNMFEGLMFAIIVHPYDVGDRCVIDGVVLLVEELNMFTTVFLKIDNEKVYYPNSVLATKAISNFNRSPDMGDTVEFTIDISTPLEKIGALKERIKRYVEANPMFWHPNHNVLVKDIQNESKLRMAIDCFHTMNFQNLEVKNRRRTELVIELKKIFEELGMRFSLSS